MATPFLDALFARFDSSEVSLLMYKHLFSILDGGPWTDTAKQIYFWNKDDTNTLVHELKAQQFDAAILLPNSFRVAWFAKKIGAKRRIGFSRDARGWLEPLLKTIPNGNEKTELLRSLFPVTIYFSKVLEMVLSTQENEPKK